MLYFQHSGRNDHFKIHVGSRRSFAQKSLLLPMSLGVKTYSARLLPSPLRAPAAYPAFLCSSHTGLLLLLIPARHVPTSGRLHWPFLPPGTPGPSPRKPLGPLPPFLSAFTWSSCPAWLARPSCLKLPSTHCRLPGFMFLHRTYHYPAGDLFTHGGYCWSLPREYRLQENMFCSCSIPSALSRCSGDLCRVND